MAGAARSPRSSPWNDTSSRALGARPGSMTWDPRHPSRSKICQSAEQLRVHTPRRHTPRRPGRGAGGGASRSSVVPPSPPTSAASPCRLRQAASPQQPHNLRAAVQLLENRRGRGPSTRTRSDAPCPSQPRAGPAGRSPPCAPRGLAHGRRSTNVCDTGSVPEEAIIPQTHLKTARDDRVPRAVWLRGRVRSARRRAGVGTG